MIWLVLLSCQLTNPEEAGDTLEFEMEGHDLDGRDAFVALAAGDVKGAKAAAKRLSRPDKVPLIGVEGQAHLDAARDQAVKAAAGRDRAQVAQALTLMTMHCSACHAKFNQSPKARPDNPTELLFTALVFEDEASWDLAAAELSVSGDTWGARREAAATLLGGPAR